MSVITQFFTTLGIGGVTAVLRAIIIFLICYIAIKVVTKVVDKLLGKSKKLDGTLKGFVKTACNIGLCT